jgi:hypothetical protein
VPTSAIVPGSGVADMSPPDGAPPPVDPPPPIGPPDPPGPGEGAPPRSGSGVPSSPSPLPGASGAGGAAGPDGVDGARGGAGAVDPLSGAVTDPEPVDGAAPPAAGGAGAGDGAGDGDGFGEGDGDGFGDGAGLGFGDGAIETALVSACALLVMTGVSAAPAPCRPNGLIACQRPPSAAEPLDEEDQLLPDRQPRDPHGVQRVTASLRRRSAPGASTRGSDVADVARADTSIRFDGNTPPPSGASDPDVPAVVSTRGAAAGRANPSGSTSASASVAGGR